MGSIQAPILLQLLLCRLFSEHIFDFRFIKFSPTSYVLEFAGGRIKRQGTGLAFLYFAPATTLVQIPIGSTDAPFIFTEVTADFQEVTVLMKSFAEIDEEKLDAIFSAGSNPAQVMAQAFKQLGGSAEKIGELNISPDLLREIMRGSER